jgi:polyisoprenoid-binding protein YceI
MNAQRILALALLVALGTGYSSPTAAAEFRFDASSASLGFEGNYGGEAVPGKFHRFSGSASFDAATPTAARFDVTIDVASLDTEYADRDDVLKSPEWFAVEQHPQARWVSTADCIAAAPGWRCPGELTLRGVTRAVAIDIGAEGAAVVGRATLNRRDFGVGSGEWDDPETIADIVTVSFRLAPLAP